MTTGALVADLAVLGTRVRVDLSGAPEELVERFHVAWRHLVEPPTDTPAGAASHAPPVVHATVRTASDGSYDDDAVRQGLVELTQRITKAAIEQQAGRALLFHAGALAHPETGATMVYVAPGGTGKTTLSRTHGQGLVYVTDETVAVLDGDTDGDAVLPYPKPLSIRRPPPHTHKDEVSPLDLDLVPADDAVRPWVAGVVLLARTDGGTGLRVESVDPLDAIVRLAPETSSLATLERPLHRLAALLERTGGARLVHYSEAGSLTDLVHEITGRTR